MVYWNLTVNSGALQWHRGWSSHPLKASALPAVSQATLNLTHECPDQSVQLSEEGFVRRTPPPGESEIGCGVLGCVMPGRYGLSWENLFCEFHMSEGMISFLQI